LVYEKQAKKNKPITITNLKNEKKEKIEAYSQITDQMLLES
jgi:hypothetical protein